MSRPAASKRRSVMRFGIIWTIGKGEACRCPLDRDGGESSLRMALRGHGGHGFATTTAATGLHQPRWQWRCFLSLSGANRSLSTPTPGRAPRCLVASVFLSARANKEATSLERGEILSILIVVGLASCKVRPFSYIFFRKSATSTHSNKIHIS